MSANDLRLDGHTYADFCAMWTRCRDEATVEIADLCRDAHGDADALEEWNRDRLREMQALRIVATSICAIVAALARNTWSLPARLDHLESKLYAIRAHAQQAIDTPEDENQSYVYAEVTCLCNTAITMLELLDGYDRAYGTDAHETTHETHNETAHETYAGEAQYPDAAQHDLPLSVRTKLAARAVAWADTLARDPDQLHDDITVCARVDDVLAFANAAVMWSVRPQERVMWRREDKRRGYLRD